ncbi:MAG: hypothetical protein WC438_01125 [Candidatus Pacearchaeota archaeon]
MKWYIASRQKSKKEVKKIINFLRAKKQEITFDWTKIPNLNPYANNEPLSSKISKQISGQIKESDIFVLLSDASGTDMYIELGMAMNNHEVSNKPRIYVVGDKNNRSLMHFHPSIVRAKNIYKVYRLERII